MTRSIATILSLTLSLTLAAAGARADDGLAALVEAFGSPEWEARGSARLALVRLGVPAMPALEEAARSADPEVVSQAARAWREIRSSLPADEAEPDFAAGLARRMPADLAGWRAEIRAVVLAASPGLVARVAAIDPGAGTVRLDLEAPVGLVFLLYREGRFVAVAEVESARPGVSIARVDPARTLRPVAVGDSATTRDPALRLAALERACELLDEERARWQWLE